MPYPVAVVADRSGSPAESESHINSNPPADSALVDRLRSLANDREDDVVVPRKPQYLIIAIAVGVLLFLGLMVFIAATIWRLHGPQFRRLDDGWYHVTDRELGFECELPGWYSRRAPWGNRGTEYTSQFDSAWGNIWILAQRWSPNNSGRTVTGELLAVVAAEQGRGTVTILTDNSSNPTAPMIDFVVEYGSAGSYAKMRRRVLIQKKVRLDITIQASDDIPVAEVNRVMDAIKAIR